MLSEQHFHRSSREQQCFQSIQHAAVSIYLSGVFDYHEALWKTHDIAIPKLQPQEIETNVETILTQVEHALRLSEINIVTYVFALRVAGARTRTNEERERVTRLLRRIERCYIVSRALIVDLTERWGSEASVQASRVRS